jgi:hypothetical protein
MSQYISNKQMFFSTSNFVRYLYFHNFSYKFIFVLKINKYNKNDMLLDDWILNMLSNKTLEVSEYLFSKSIYFQKIYLRKKKWSKNFSTIWQWIFLSRCLIYNRSNISIIQIIIYGHNNGRRESTWHKSMCCHQSIEYAIRIGTIH